MAPIRQPIASDGTGPNTRAQVAEHVPAPHQNTRAQQAADQAGHAAPEDGRSGQAALHGPGL